MPSRPRDQWLPNEQLRAAREEAYGRKSRTPFARAVKRACERRHGGYCGVDHRKVRRWEEGACAPDAGHQEVICDLFGVPWEDRVRLGFGAPATRASHTRGPRETVRLEPAAGVGTGIVVVGGQGAGCEGVIGAAGLAGDGRPRQEGRSAKRREFMRLVQVFACTPVPLDALERFAAYLERPRAVDEALVCDVERVTAAVGAAYDTTAPRRLLVPARLLVSRTGRLLSGGMLPAQRQRVLGCASQGALVVGYLRFSLDERVDAAAYFLLAEELAAEAPDAILQAWALGASSELYSTTYQGRNAARAFELAERANATLPGHASASVCSWLAMNEAIERAASRDVAGYERLTERAQVAGLAVQNELPMFGGWFGGWDEGFLNGHNGTCLYLLERPALAEPLLLDALARDSSVRRRARIASDLAGVYATQDPETACRMGMQALTCVLEVGFVLGMQRLLVVRQGFPTTVRQLSLVQEFDEALQAAKRTLRMRSG